MSKLGQYFTINPELQNEVYKFILNNPKNILEPSIGKGHLIESVLLKKKDIEFDMYEIDKSLEFLKCIDKSKIHFGDFLKQKINKKFTTIIGNPPYIRTKKGNLYIDFIEKCVDLLDSNGELIFIIPSDFFKLTSASKLLSRMISQGNFTHIYHPNNEKLFENASIDVLIFRYQKNTKLDNTILYNNETKYLQHKNGIITFTKEENLTDHISLSDIFEIYVGMVSGKDEFYKNKKHGNISLLSGNNKIEEYIYIKEFPSKNKELNDYFLENKENLINRKIKKFNEKNWFEWGAMRNKSTIEKNIDKPCIYIHNLTRKKEVAFCGKVMYFNGNLLILIPKKDNINLAKIVEYLNSDEFKENFMFSNRFKIGHKQLCNIMIPNSLIT
jgi:adenine-specific DNA-methyltransferase